MKTRWLLSVVALAAAPGALVMAACADDANTAAASDAPTVVTDPGDAHVDGDGDALEDVPCADCEYFPEICEPSTFCPNGPFGTSADPTAPGGLDLRTQINVIRGRGTNDVWAAGALGALAHFDGTSWTVSNADAAETLYGLWLRDGSEAAIGKLDKVFVHGGAASADAGTSPDGWTVTPIVPSTGMFSIVNTRFKAAFAAPSAKHLWCASSAPNLGSTSGLWRLEVAEDGTWNIGIGVDPSLCNALPCSQILAVHGSSADDVWAVGTGGAAVHVTGADGDAPVMKAFDTRTWNVLNGVWAASANEAWAVGVGGVVRHHAGDALRWDIVDGIPTSTNLNAIWGSSTTDIWAVGDAGVVLHFDGQAWTRVKIAGLGVRRPDLTTVWMPEPGHVWIGGRGVVLSLGGKP